jgi:hypothetical protein
MVAAMTGSGQASSLDRPVAAAEGARPAPTPAEAAFLERCREDLAGLFGPNDVVEAILLRAIDDEAVELEARVVVSGWRGSFAARGETIVEAYGRLRAAAPEQRIALAFRVLVNERAGSSAFRTAEDAQPTRSRRAGR